MATRSFFLFLFAITSFMANAEEYYINCRTGNDANPGSLSQPLRTLAEAARRIDLNPAKASATVILQEGVYPLTETILFNNNKFSENDRLIIRAEILPGDAGWEPQRMPIITTIIPGKQTPNNGDEARGLEIEVSHVTIEGLRFTGTPDFYSTDEKLRHRYYPVWRDNKNLDDLLVTQCLFAGSVDVSPIRVAVIANGHGLVVDHCVFFNCENPVVFWEADGGISNHNAMRYCLVYGSDYSGVWTTTNTGNDFEFHHNIIANGRTAWIRDNNSLHIYQVHDCIFSNNMKLTGNGGDKEIGNDFLKMNNVQLTGAIEIEKDRSKNNYLQLKEGSFGSELKAGLFKK